MGRKRRLRVSSDNGETWKTRWVDPMQFNPRLSDIKEGELVWVNGCTHKAVVKDGRLTCPPLALALAFEQGPKGSESTESAQGDSPEAEE